MTAAREQTKLQLIASLIGLIRSQLSHYDEDLFVRDRDAIDSTAFRILAIGEAARGLSDDLRSRHPAIDWRGMAAMRNVMAHDYNGIVPAFLWRVYSDRLTALELTVQAELASASDDRKK